MKKSKILQEMKNIKNCKYQINHVLEPHFKNPDVVKYLLNLRKNLNVIPVLILPLIKSVTPLKFTKKKPFQKLFRTNTNILNFNMDASSKLGIRKVQRNQKIVLKPLTDPDFNYTAVKKKIDQMIINPRTDEMLLKFKHEIEYHEIKVLFCSLYNKF